MNSNHLEFMNNVMVTSRLVRDSVVTAARRGEVSDHIETAATKFYHAAETLATAIEADAKLYERPEEDPLTVFEVK